MKSHYPLNPNCSTISVVRGTNCFIYFYYKSDGKRKLVKFSNGLNSKGVTENKRTKLIKELCSEIDHKLQTKVYDGKNFNDVNIKSVINPEIPIKDAIEQYLNSRKGLVSETTISNYTIGIEFFTKFLKVQQMENIKLYEIDTFLIEDYVKYMLSYQSSHLKRNLSIKTIREYKDRLSFVLNHFIRKGVLTKNPVHQAQFGNALNTNDSKKHKVFSVQEFQDIIQYLKDHRQPPYLTMVLMIYYTHLRPREICRLQLEDFDMERRYIHLKAAKAKTRRERSLAIDKPLYDHLISLNIEFSDPDTQKHYFFSYNKRDRIGFVGLRQYNYSNMHYSFQQIKKDLNLHPDSTFYGIKHTATVHERLYEGFSIDKIKVKNGHKNIAQTETYLRNLDDLLNIPEEVERKLKFKI